MSKPKICLLERKNYHAIKLDCNDRWNIGLLEKAAGTLANNNGRLGSLVEMIRREKGDFKKIAGRKFVESKNGASKTCGGTPYTGWVVFGTVKAAVKYLEQYFSVKVCRSTQG